MIRVKFRRPQALALAAALAVAVLAATVAAALAAQDRPGDRKKGADDTPPAAAAAARADSSAEGPAIEVKPHPHRTGDATAGKDVFRFETFGNEGFWTDAMRMPAGMEDHKVTPLDALKTGLLVDSEAVPPEMMRAMAKELKTDLSPQNAPMLNDPMTTVKLIEANAVVGMVPKDTNGDGAISLAAGDKVGVSCAICHTITADPVFEIPGAGSIGRRVDGPAALVLNVGKLLATAANSRAYYPNLQLELGGKTIGRAPAGLTEDSTEAEVDAYLSNPKFYPVGTFDETSDGIGNPVVNQPLFRQDLAAPYATAGEFAVLDDISNASYTMNLDLTSLVTPDGRQFLKIRAGKLGEELADDYAKILKETGVKGHPFVKASVGHKVGVEQHPVGRRVDDQKLIDMNAYLDSLPDPDGASVNAESFARGRELFMANQCTACHNVDQGKPVPAMLVELDTLFPGYKPEILAKRMPPLTPVQNSPGGFDDKMVVIDASGRGDIRGNALPMLLDLARKDVFLHDASVKGLDLLLNPERGEKKPHPFYLADEGQRADVIAFLEGSDTRRGASGDGGASPETNKSDKPAIKEPGIAPKEAPPIPPPDARAAEVPEGYRVEVAIAGLQYPSSLEFDDEGNLYVAESGLIDGDLIAPSRILKIGSGGERTVAADGFTGPLTDLLWHDGRMYVSHRGRISVVEGGKVRHLATGLPSFGDHHNNQMTAGPDGKIYFGQGTATNSGVVGVDNYLLGWLAPYPDMHDVPGRDVTLRGQAFEAPDPLNLLAKQKLRTVKTSAFQAFGKTAAEGMVVAGQAKSTGAVLRMNADGSGIETYAWGFRNPFGVMWGPDGKLYASDNGYDERGSRPVANSADNLWVVKEGAWYGWPDFSSGVPITDEQFKPAEGPPPQFLMAEHPKVEKPLLLIPPHASATKIDFSTNAAFGFEGQMFLAASGDYAPATAAKQERSGFYVLSIDPKAGEAKMFFRAKKSALGPKDEEYVLTAGPKRPVDVRFSPEGDALYVVDIGAVTFIRTGQGPTPRPFPGTGVVWKVTRGETARAE